MNLEHAFYRLPLRFDAHQLFQEMSARAESEWILHPNQFKGNSALILVSVGGQDNHDTHGRMTPCRRLAEMPYFRQVMATLPTVIGRARIMRLAPGAKVTRHTDVSFYWRHRMRLHIPIITDPDVRFFSMDKEVHMAAGEVWTFNNWVYHEVHNNSDIIRTHLVIDTVGSPELWAMLEQQSHIPGVREAPAPNDQSIIRFNPKLRKPIALENFNIEGVLPPSDVDMIVDEFMADLDRNSLAAQDIEKTSATLKVLKRGWRAIWSVHGDTEQSKVIFRKFLDDVRHALGTISPPPKLISNETVIADGLNVQLGGTLAESSSSSLKPGVPVQSAP